MSIFKYFNFSGDTPFTIKNKAERNGLWEGTSSWGIIKIKGGNDCQDFRLTNFTTDVYVCYIQTHHPIMATPGLVPPQNT